MIRNQYKTLAEARAAGAVPLKEMVAVIEEHSTQAKKAGLVYKLGLAGGVSYIYREDGVLQSPVAATAIFLREEVNQLGRLGKIVYVYDLANLPEEVRGWLAEGKPETE
jgi:hypothetical protein